jgi:hypothetical protein
MVITGEKLSPKQRKDFGALAEQMYNAAAERYNQSAEEFRSTARDYNLNADRIAKPAKKSTFSAGGWSAQRK